MDDSRQLLGDEMLQIGFYGVGKAPYPEDVIAPAVLRALAQHQKVDLQTQGVFWGDYCYFAGVTGEAFRLQNFMEHPKPGVPEIPLVERYGQLSSRQMMETSLAAAGLECRVYQKGSMPDGDQLRRQIVESIRDRRTPVIGIGVFGSPVPFLVTGYDHGGDVLLGWSHLQQDAKVTAALSFEPTGQFRLRNWQSAADAFIVITGNANRPAQREVYRAALQRAIRELGTTGDGIGLAAMEKWAAHIESDADFAGVTPDQWRKAHSDHSTTAGDLAERRMLASSFLELASRVLPEAKGDLRMAQAAFQGSHDTIYEIWETVAKTGPFDPDMAKFQDPARRRTIASLIRRLAELDRHGMAYLQRAMRTVEGQEPGPAIAPNALLDGTVTLKKAELPPSGHRPIWGPENIHIANTMGMLRGFLGEPFGPLNEVEKANPKLDYALWMGFSGAAFGMLADGPERSNLPLMFDALGYDYEIWMPRKLAEETGLSGVRDWGWDDNLRRRIFWNLRDRQLPVLVFDCGQWPDWWLLTRANYWNEFRGYGGQNGEGYRPNEPMDDPKNPLRVVDAMGGMKGKQTWTINVLGKRSTPKPSMEELYRRAVEFGRTKMRQQRMKLLGADGKEFISDRPYEEWAQMMRTDALFPADNPKVLKERRDALEGDEVELAERRHYGAAFLEQAAIRLNRPELKEAAAHFRNVLGLMRRIWEKSGGPGSPLSDGYKSYANPDVRNAIADLLLEIQMEDDAAAELLAN